jgi:hypothetical protein
MAQGFMIWKRGGRGDGAAEPVQKISGHAWPARERNPYSNSGPVPGAWGSGGSAPPGQHCGLRRRRPKGGKQPSPPRPPRPRLVTDDLDFYRGGDFGVQADPDLVRPDGLDGVGHLDPALVELRATGGADCLGNVARAHRAEQPA